MLARRGTRPKAHSREWLVGVAMLLPALAGFVVFQALPIGTALQQSLQSFNPFTHAANGYVWFDNYRQMVADPHFSAALRNTVLYIVLVVGIEIPVGLCLAELINRRLFGSTLVKLAIVATMATSETVAILIWNQIYEPEHGLLNAFLNTVGIPSQPLLSSSAQALPALVLMTVWKDIGLPTLIFLAGLQSCSPEMREAARLDGAGELRLFWSITIPQLRRSMLVAGFMATIAGSRVFTPIILGTQGGPGQSTSNLIYYAYQNGFQYSNYGIASAATMTMLAILALITAGQGLLLRDKQET